MKYKFISNDFQSGGQVLTREKLKQPRGILNTATFLGSRIAFALHACVQITIGEERLAKMAEHLYLNEGRFGSME